jgi:hypothetical protein
VNKIQPMHGGKQAMIEILKSFPPFYYDNEMRSMMLSFLISFGTNGSLSSSIDSDSSFRYERLTEQLVLKWCAEAYKLLEWIGNEHDKGTDLRKVIFGDYVEKKEIRNELGDEILKKSIGRILFKTYAL